MSRVDASIASRKGTGRGSGQPLLAEAECDRAFLHFLYVLFLLLRSSDVAARAAIKIPREL